MSSLTRYTKKQTPSITGKKTPDSKKTGNKKNKKKRSRKNKKENVSETLSNSTSDEDSDQNTDEDVLLNVTRSLDEYQQALNGYFREVVERQKILDRKFEQLYNVLKRKDYHQLNEEDIALLNNVIVHYNNIVEIIDDLKKRLDKDIYFNEHVNNQMRQEYTKWANNIDGYLSAKSEDINKIMEKMREEQEKRQEEETIQMEIKERSEIQKTKEGAEKKFEDKLSLSENDGSDSVESEEESSDDDIISDTSEEEKRGNELIYNRKKLTPLPEAVNKFSLLFSEDTPPKQEEGEESSDDDGDENFDMDVEDTPSEEGEESKDNDSEDENPEIDTLSKPATKKNSRTIDVKYLTAGLLLVTTLLVAGEKIAGYGDNNFWQGADLSAYSADNSSQYLQDNSGQNNISNISSNSYNQSYGDNNFWQGPDLSAYSAVNSSQYLQDNIFNSSSLDSNSQIYEPQNFGQNNIFNNSSSDSYSQLYDGPQNLISDEFSEIQTVSSPVSPFKNFQTLAENNYNQQIEATQSVAPPYENALETIVKSITDTSSLISNFSVQQYRNIEGGISEAHKNFADMLIIAYNSSPETIQTLVHNIVDNFCSSLTFNDMLNIKDDKVLQITVNDGNPVVFLNRYGKNVNVPEDKIRNLNKINVNIVKMTYIGRNINDDRVDVQKIHKEAVNLFNEILSKEEGGNSFAKIITRMLVVSACIKIMTKDGRERYISRSIRSLTNLTKKLGSVVQKTYKTTKNIYNSYIFQLVFGNMISLFLTFCPFVKILVDEHNSNSFKIKVIGGVNEKIATSENDFKNISTDVSKKVIPDVEPVIVSEEVTTKTEPAIVSQEIISEPIVGTEEVISEPIVGTEEVISEPIVGTEEVISEEEIVDNQEDEELDDLLYAMENEYFDKESIKSIYDAVLSGQFVIDGIINSDSKDLEENLEVVAESLENIEEDVGEMNPEIVTDVFETIFSSRIDLSSRLKFLSDNGGPEMDCGDCTQQDVEKVYHNLLKFQFPLNISYKMASKIRNNIFKILDEYNAVGMENVMINTAKKSIDEKFNDINNEVENVFEDNEELIGGMFGTPLEYKTSPEKIQETEDSVDELTESVKVSEPEENINVSNKEDIIRRYGEELVSQNRLVDQSLQRLYRANQYTDTLFAEKKVSEFNEDEIRNIEMMYKYVQDINGYLDNVEKLLNSSPEDIKPEFAAFVNWLQQNRISMAAWEQKIQWIKNQIVSRPQKSEARPESRKFKRPGSKKSAPKENEQVKEIDMEISQTKNNMISTTETLIKQGTPIRNIAPVIADEKEKIEELIAEKEKILSTSVELENAMEDMLMNVEDLIKKGTPPKDIIPLVEEQRKHIEELSQQQEELEQKVSKDENSLSKLEDKLNSFVEELDEKKEEIIDTAKELIGQGVPVGEIAEVIKDDKENVERLNEDVQEMKILFLTGKLEENKRELEHAKIDVVYKVEELISNGTPVKDIASIISEEKDVVEELEAEKEVLDKELSDGLFLEFQSIANMVEDEVDENKIIPKINATKSILQQIVHEDEDEEDEVVSTSSGTIAESIVGIVRELSPDNIMFREHVKSEVNKGMDKIEKIDEMKDNFSEILRKRHYSPDMIEVIIEQMDKYRKKEVDNLVNGVILRNAHLMNITEEDLKNVRLRKNKKKQKLLLGCKYGVKKNGECKKRPKGRRGIDESYCPPGRVAYRKNPEDLWKCIKKKKSKSPKRKSKSPKRKSKSPKRKSKSPKRKSKSPKRKSKSPKRKSKSPKRKSKSPKRKSKSPKRKSKSPKRKSKSPKRKSKSPKRKKNNK